MQRASAPSIISLSLLNLMMLVGASGCSERMTKARQLLEQESSPTADAWSPSMYLDTFNQITNPELPHCQETIAAPPASESSVIRLVGFDAVSWRILNVLLAKNELPNCQRLLRQGARAILETDWADSPVSWTTIAAGKSMDKHGILTFHVTGRSAFNYANDAVQTARIWEMLVSQGITTTVGRYFFHNEALRQNLTMVEECARVLSLIAAAPNNYFIGIVEMTDIQFHTSLLPYVMLNTDWFNTLTINPFWQSWIERHATATVECLREMDRTIGEIVRLYPSDTLILVSDHGSSVKDPKITVSVEPSELFPNAEISGKEFRETVRLESGITVKLKQIPHYFNLASDQVRDYFMTIYTVTLVIDTPEACPQETIAELYKSLLNLEVRGTKLLIQRAENLDFNPDLIGQVVLDGLSHKLIREIYSIGEHDRRDPGFFVAYGPAIKPNTVAKRYRLEDVTPTILYLANLPIGRDMDGQPALDMIQPEFIAQHPVTYVDSYDDLVARDFSPDAHRKLSLEERLKYRKVGYPGLE